jgi:DNA-binding GntR family transcriptional regulator
MMDWDYAMTPNATHLDGSQLQIDQAYAALRKAIIRCELPPSAVVTELHLATQFGYGRAAVRSALTRLTHDGLVQVLPRRGYGVTPVTFTHVRDLYGTRLIVEPAVARLAAETATPDLLIELEHWNKLCRFDPGQPDLVTPREANKSFHATIGRACGNDRLAALSATLMDELDRVLYLPHLAPLWERLEHTAEEHQRIIDALRARDAGAAEQAAADHVLANRRDAIEALIASPGLGAVNLLTV